MKRPRRRLRNRTPSCAPFHPPVDVLRAATPRRLMTAQPLPPVNATARLLLTNPCPNSLDNRTVRDILILSNPPAEVRYVLRAIWCHSPSRPFPESPIRQYHLATRQQASTRHPGESRGPSSRHCALGGMDSGFHRNDDVRGPNSRRAATASGAGGRIPFLTLGENE